MDLIILAVPVFVLLMIAEWLYGLAVGRNTYRLNDTINSLSMGALRTLGKLVFFDASVYLFNGLASATEIIQWSMSWPEHWYVWLLAFFVYDFFYYWFHRISHERSLFWAAHVAHHQSEEFNLSTALRQTGTGWLCSWVFFLPMFAMGCPPELFYTVAAVNLLYQFWVHTEHVPELGWFEKIFVSPSNHRVHHACNECYMDKNYGGVFIIWDRMFGSYQRELEQQPCRFGISIPLKSWNPLWANVHVYADMLHVARSSSSALSAAFATPSELKARSLGPEEALAVDQAKYDPVLDGAVRWYVIIQFFLVLAVANVLPAQAAEYSQWQLISGFAYVLLGFSGLGILLEGRKQGMRWEFLRHAVTAVASGYIAVTLGSSMAAVLFFATLFMVWQLNSLDDKLS